MSARPIILQYDVTDHRPRFEADRVVLVAPPVGWQIAWLSLLAGVATTISIAGGTIGLAALFGHPVTLGQLAGGVVFLASGAWVVTLVQRIVRQWQFGSLPVIIETAGDRLVIEAPYRYEHPQLVQKHDILLIDIAPSGLAVNLHGMYALTLFLASRSNVKLQFQTDRPASVTDLQHQLRQFFDD